MFQPSVKNRTKAVLNNSKAPRQRLTRVAAATLLLGMMPMLSYAIDDVKETPEAFLAEAFGAAVPPPKALDLTDPVQSKLMQTFGKQYPQQRLRYWKSGTRSAWILDDIGKDGYVPTTTGFIVQNGAIQAARVLIYRESRGDQVADPSFTKQFTGAHLAGAQLDRQIDGISGATLSVQMMQRLARAALTLDSVAP
ncbi:FMN-binding protein [Paraburkholderia aspalathi]|uniref:FMN-binding protein n=1 Tax=Paraburkholderia aspalathi TaxID=1324617 RepID=UPI003CBD9810